MTINRHNYEEFFLLYVDHELSAGERKVVETFIRENSDLEEELVMLQQSKLKPDHGVFFENKKSLLKQSSGNGLISEMNYEEFFVLYVDGELSDSEKSDVEKFIFQYPHLRQELDLLHQTSLKPDLDIIFEKKEILFRHEEKPAGALILPWLRFSAAAAILLLAGLLVFNNINHHASQTLAVDNKLHTIPPGAPDKKNITSTVTPPIANPLQDGKQQVQKNGIVKQSSSKKVLSPERKIAAVDEIQMNLANETPAQKVATASPSAADKEVSIAGLIGKVNPTADHPIAITDFAAKAPQDENTNQLVSQASFNNMANDPENGISILTTSSGKNKMRGLFRKVSRVFEKTTGIDEDRDKSVLVGNFQIALK